MSPALVVDVGTSTSAAMVVSDHGAWLVPDPHTAAPPLALGDALGRLRLVGRRPGRAAAVAGPDRLRGRLQAGLDTDEPALLGQRRCARPTCWPSS